MTVTRSAVIAVAVLALLAGACSRSQDPAAELAEAMDRALADSLAYRITVTADTAALDALGDDGPAAAAFLNSFAVAGVRTPAGNSLRLQLFGQDLLDVRTAGDVTSVRLALADLPGVPPALTEVDALLPALRGLQLEADVEAGLVTLLRGGWLAIEGPLDASDLLATASRPEARTDVDEAFGATTVDRVERFVVVGSVSEADGRRTFRSELQLRDLLRATAEAGAFDGGATLDDLPATLPATFVVEDGVLVRARLDLGALTQDAGSSDGVVELQLDLSDHGSARAPEAPAAEARVEAGSLVEAVGALLRFSLGLGVG